MFLLEPLNKRFELTLRIIDLSIEQIGTSRKSSRISRIGSPVDWPRLANYKVEYGFLRLRIIYGAAIGEFVDL